MGEYDLDKLELYRPEDSIYVEKGNGTRVNYFIFDEFEIHENVISPKSAQEWHMHRAIEEVLVVTSGELTVRWKEEGGIYRETASKGMVIRVGNSVHTIENRTNEEAAFLVFRMVPDGKDKRNVIKHDKVIFP
ncbi:MAG: cupin domain-containing protein [Clostridiales bacterium]|nr:cupin domain-containing protein [Clostridiales bacterium]